MDDLPLNTGSAKLEMGGIHYDLDSDSSPTFRQISMCCDWKGGKAPEQAHTCPRDLS
jgi:hypothetical protein